MRIAVLGAGAMGSIFGGKLTEAGEDVVFVDISKSLVERLESQGLRLVDQQGERVIRVRATTNPASIGKPDVVFVFVKCYQTESALAFGRPLLGDQTLVTTLQNGWGNGDVLAGVVPVDRVVVGINYHSGTVLEPGKVAHTRSGSTVIGPWDGQSEAAARRIGEVFERAGLPTEVTLNIREKVWGKVTLNSATLPVAALTRLRAGRIGEPGAVLEVVHGLARETVAVGRSLGFEIDPDEEIATIDRVLREAGDGKASMLQDIEANRQTEIDVINGAVVRLGDEHGVPVPLNRVMLALVKGYEQAQGIGK